MFKSLKFKPQVFNRSYQGHCSISRNSASTRIISTRSIYTRTAPRSAFVAALPKLILFATGITASILGYRHFFVNGFPDAAKDHLRRALVGQRTNEPFENIENEFRLAIKACLQCNPY
jgi:hypothetical protein